MSDALMPGGGAARAAETLLRGAGRTVKLRLPQPAAGDDIAEELGVSTAEFQDVELGPCVFRKTGKRRELLVSAEAVRGVVGSLAFDSAGVLFGSAAGVVCEDTLLLIESVAPVEAAGVAVCYRVLLRA